MKKPSAVSQFAVGDIVEVRDGPDEPWRTGTVIKKTTRLHVGFRDYQGHLAYDASMINRGNIRKKASQAVKPTTVFKLVDRAAHNRKKAAVPKPTAVSLYVERVRDALTLREDERSCTGKWLSIHPADYANALSLLRSDIDGMLEGANDEAREVDEQEQVAEEPVCGGCHRSVTDSPGAGCKTPKEHGMMGGRVDMTDQEFVDLTVVSEAGSKHGQALWMCRCKCGARIKVRRSDLVRGAVRACPDCTPKAWCKIEPTLGQIEALVAWKEKHGRAWRTRLGEAWMRASYPGFDDKICAALQQVRNILGTRWLYSKRCVI